MTLIGKLKQAAGYVWAAVVFAAAMAALPHYESLGRRIAAAGFRISPVFSGGEVARTIERGGYRVFIHRPVFDSLLREKKDGFVQIDWGPYEALRGRLTEKLDLYGDGREESVLELDTAATEISLRTSDCRVGPAEAPLVVDKPRVIRLYREPEPAPGPGAMKKITVRVRLRKNCAPARG